MLFARVLVTFAYPLETVQLSLYYHLAALLVQHHQGKELVLVEIVLQLVLSHQLVLRLDALLEVRVEVDQQRPTFAVLLRLGLE